MKILSEEFAAKLRQDIILRFQAKLDASFEAVEQACAESNPEHLKSVNVAYIHAKIVLNEVLREMDFEAH